ncbi:MAG: hypothetical protein IJU86_04610 [Firmicutes bacterium]|nr:hypothetical protein [Bacillota bacterium]
MMEEEEIKNQTFFDLSDDDNKNKIKIDGAKKILDSIFETCEAVDKQFGMNKNDINIPENGITISTGTDYHGDRVCFQAGAVSELVTWEKDKISVMDAVDGEELYTGSIDDIKKNCKVIKNKLDKKYEERKQTLHKHVVNLIKEKINKQDFIKAYNQYFLRLYKKTKAETWIRKNYCLQLSNSNELLFSFTDDDCFVIRDFNDNSKETKINISDLVADILKNGVDESVKKFCGGIDDRVKKFLQTICKELVPNEIVEKQHKVVMVHDCKLKENLDMSKKKVRLTGDYIDRGDGSTEILCMILKIKNKIDSDEKLKQEADCFVTISGNHESKFYDPETSDMNKDNDRNANQLAKRMIANGQLVSGSIIKPPEHKNNILSFSHSYFTKVDCFLTIEQIFELEDLAQNIDKSEWFYNDSNKNQFVSWINSKFNEKAHGGYGKKILELLVERYNKVKNLKKYKRVFNKFRANMTYIKSLHDQYMENIFDKLSCLKSGRDFYQKCKTIFSDYNFLMLRYFVMDTLVYPITDTIDHEFDLISSHATNLFNAINPHRTSETSCAFSDFFSPGGKDSIKCLSSLKQILDGDWKKSAINNLNWQRFIEGLSKDDFLPGVLQFVGHDAVEEHKSIIYDKNTARMDIFASHGYNKKRQNQNQASYVHKTFINANNPKENCELVYKVEYSDKEKTVDLFSNQKLDLEFSEAEIEFSDDKDEIDEEKEDKIEDENKNKVKKIDINKFIINKTNGTYLMKLLLIIIGLLLIAGGIGLFFTATALVFKFLAIGLGLLGAVGFGIGLFYNKIGDYYRAKPGSCCISFFTYIILACKNLCYEKKKHRSCGTKIKDRRSVKNRRSFKNNLQKVRLIDL